ncbi:minor tail protein [Microbacterium phage Paschalis]|uniref:Minor tail protein n=1 Tax=Microbacterium phage Paschalis TaxID=2992928 RepID=A0A2U8UPL7_9CAUD|nr:minor tail protein [Microbacterium phage Paschalis]AWN05530.1 minor tail protein [Microbacterium phage Paschalis]
MAYDASISAPYSGRPSYYSYLYVRRDQTDVANNRSSYAWAYYARGPANVSYALDCFGWAVNVGGQGFSGCSNLDFRGRGEIGLGGNTTGWFGHDGNGYLSIVIDSYHGPASIFGTSDPGAVWFGTDRIPRTPATVNAPTVSNVGTDRMTLSWNIPDNRGSAIDAMLLRRYPTSDTSIGGYTDYPLAANATSHTPTGLAPATTYYWVVYARNGVGYSAQSGKTAGTTLPATPPPFTVEPALSGLQAVVKLTPPSGSTGVTSYTIEYQEVGSTTVKTLTGASPITVMGLTPGKSIRWRALANYGSVKSPWSDWVTYFQPNPNTNPGQYFDGSTADTADVDYQWTGTVNNSVSRAVGKKVTGWAAFATAAQYSGGTGAMYRVTGAIGRHPDGSPAGSYSARYAFFSDATAVGFRAGLENTAQGRAEVSEGGVYFASIYARPSKTQRLAAEITWYNSAGIGVSRLMGPSQLVEAGQTVVLGVNGMAAQDGFAIVTAVDVAGDGWNLWRGGDTITVDAAMITVGAAYAFFDGSSPDTTQFDYSWTGLPNASTSIRTTLAADAVDPLADPDCPAPPTPPGPPAIEDDCITEVGVWRRYWVQIAQPEVAEWVATIPTLTLTTGAQPAREVRIRYYENPDETPPSAFTPGDFVAEQIIRYIPPGTSMILDGVSERARASVGDGEYIAADHLVYGTGGAPATWPVLECGLGFLVSLDVPLDAQLGNLTTELSLTRRML